MTNDYNKSNMELKTRKIAIKALIIFVNEQALHLLLIVITCICARAMTTAGLMSTHTIFTWDVNMLPTAIE